MSLGDESSTVIATTPNKFLAESYELHICFPFQQKQMSLRLFAHSDFSKEVFEETVQVGYGNARSKAVTDRAFFLNDSFGESLVINAFLFILDLSEVESL